VGVAGVGSAMIMDIRVRNFRASYDLAVWVSGLFDPVDGHWGKGGYDIIAPRKVTSY